MCHLRYCFRVLFLSLPLAWLPRRRRKIETVSDNSYSKKGKSGGHATERRDSAGGVAKAKKEHPEAPDPAIGMQDERGGRGGR